MKTNRFVFLALPAVCLLITASSIFAQKTKVVAKSPKSIIFAVVDDGKSIEPLAYIEKGKLIQPVDGSAEQSLIEAFTKTYYKPGTIYKMVFGGTESGSATVKNSNAKTDCAKNLGTVISKPAKTPLKGFVMALATNAPITNKAAGYRRKPTADEKAEIDALVKKEFVKQKLTPTTLKYHNLTAIDVDNDGKAEFVGTYWIDIDKLTRGMLFFIADNDSNGKYSLGFIDYRKIDQGEVMSGAIKDVDDGIYHELLLDTFDYDGDGVGEIFTHVQSFEGAGFSAYKRSSGKWTRVYEGSNYHCAY